MRTPNGPWLLSVWLAWGAAPIEALLGVKAYGTRPALASNRDCVLFTWASETEAQLAATLVGLAGYRAVVEWDAKLARLTAGADGAPSSLSLATDRQKWQR